MNIFIIFVEFSSYHLSIRFETRVLRSILFSSTLSMGSSIRQTARVWHSYKTSRLRGSLQSRDVNILWHVNALLGYATDVTQPTSKHLATEYTLRNNRGSGVFSVPCWAEPHRALLHNMSRWCHTAPRSFPRQLRCKHGDDATVLLVNPLLGTMTWRDLTQQCWLALFRIAVSGDISEAVSSSSSVLRSEFAESVLVESFEVWRFYLKCVMKTMREWNLACTDCKLCKCGTA
jgi:hypothetical protein